MFSQFSIFTADCLRHPIQMAGVETIWELHTLPVITNTGSQAKEKIHCCRPTFENFLVYSGGGKTID